MEKVILGLDIGIASVGVAVIGAETHEIKEASVRLFSSAEASENVSRREFRGIRRNKRRKRNRLNEVNEFLEKNGFHRPYGANFDPLQIRVKGLSEEISKEEIYVALYNMIKHRGVSYLEDLEEVKENDKVLQNFSDTNLEYPCLIQQERMNQYGFFRGTNTVDDKILINTFTIGSYEKEVRALLATQSKYHTKITEEFIESFVVLLKRKREYYQGPGNELSRTNYGIYKTSGKTLDNLFDDLRGSCSVYDGKNGMEKYLRASQASFSAQYYNALNDVCNIKVDGEKLTKDQREKLIELLKNNNTNLKISAALKKLYKIEASQISGYRVDRANKEENHCFQVYRAMKKNLATKNIDIDKFSIETMDAIADILTLNTETQGIHDYFKNHKRPEYELIKEVSEKEIEALTEFRRKEGKYFKNWSSFSYKLINTIVGEMLESGDEQQTVIQRLKLKKTSTEAANKIDEEAIIDEIYNPVVSRSIRQTIKIINVLSKKYDIKDIVIEMPRDKNTDDQKQNIKDMQKNNEELAKKALEYAGVTIDVLDFKKDRNIMQKLKLYYKQEGKCMYSGKLIDLKKLLENSYEYEIDHIIPISISFDDSQSNKVLVEAGHNREKGNMTPFQYLSKVDGKWGYNEYKTYVLYLWGKKLITNKHKDNYLNQDNITKLSVVQGFINRNINDTRYASRTILNVLQTYYKNKGSDTKVKVINGTMTSQLRKNTLLLEKNRDANFKHHAQDAMICCYAILSLNKYSEEYINIETGEIVNMETIRKLNKDEKASYLTFTGHKIKERILDFDDKIKFSHKIDTKVNRGVSNQTIYGTRKIKEEDYVVDKIKDIYDVKEYIKMKKVIDKNPETFLMYKHDQKTWSLFMDVINMFPDAKKESPFKMYRDKFGPFRKYSKKGNGPIIKEVKYLHHKLKTHLDITHKYKGTTNKVVLEKLSPFRADVYYDTNKKQFNIIPIKYADFKFVEGKYVLPYDVYSQILVEEKLLHKNESYQDMEEKGHVFQFSLFKNSVIEHGKDGINKFYRFLAKNHSSKNYFEVKGIDCNFEKQTYVGLSKITTFNKYNVDILGNMHRVEKEELQLEFKIDNKMI